MSTAFLGKARNFKKIQRFEMSFKKGPVTLYKQVLKGINRIADGL
jgi:hypothetical protein